MSDELSAEEASRLFEEQCRARLGISADLFVAMLRDGLLDPCDPDVSSLALAVPLYSGDWHEKEG